VLDVLGRCKAEIVALLPLGREGWSTEDWEAFFDKRAGIASSMAACRDRRQRPRRSLVVPPMLRLTEPIEWAGQHGTLESVAGFLRELREEDWLHLGE